VKANHPHPHLHQHPHPSCTHLQTNHFNGDIQRDKDALLRAIDQSRQYYARVSSEQEETIRRQDDKITELEEEVRRLKEVHTAQGEIRLVVNSEILELTLTTARSNEADTPELASIPMLAANALHLPPRPPKNISREEAFAVLPLIWRYSTWITLQNNAISPSWIWCEKVIRRYGNNWMKSQKSSSG